MMADDLGGSDGGDEVAAAFVSVGANLNPAIMAITQISSKLAGPLSQMSNFMTGFTTNALSTGMANLSDALGMNVGKLIEGYGNSLLQGTTGVASKLVGMIPLLGPILGPNLKGLVDSIGGGLISGVAKVVQTIMNPLRNAMSASLLDWDLWVQKSIGAEAAMARFNATLSISGSKVGYTSEQLGYMAKEISGKSSFSSVEVRDGMLPLLRMEKVRGEVFARATQASADMAAIMGGDMSSSAQMLGRALEDPERVLQRLRRAGVMFTKEQQDAIKKLANGGDIVGAQGKVLDILQQKMGGAAEQMGQTVQAKLKRLNKSWEDIGKDIGGVFLPLVSLTTDIAQSLVTTLAGGVGPVFRDLKGKAQGFADSVRGFFKENAGAFGEWGNLVKDIIGNVYGLLKTAFGALTAKLDLGGVNSYWEAFRAGLTETLNVIATATSSWDNFAAAANLAWVEVKTLALDVWDQVKDALQQKGIWERMKDGMKSAWDWFMVVADKAFDWLAISFSKSMAKSLAGTFADLPGDFGRIFRGQMESLELDQKLAAKKLRRAMDAQAAAGNAPFVGPMPELEGPELPGRERERREARDDFAQRRANRQPWWQPIADALEAANVNMRPNAEKPEADHKKGNISKTGFAELANQIQSAIKPKDPIPERQLAAQQAIKAAIDANTAVAKKVVEEIRKPRPLFR
ncbi:MAG: phage tail length tape measure family protein [Gemmataceae bacterium]|nr:phage tail length tape measure family protein [Gemmataceae bacterium]